MSKIVNYHNHPLGIKNGCVQNETSTRVKNALLHKLGFVQPPYFYTP